MTQFQILLFVFLAIDINFLFVSRISQPFFRGIPKYMRGSSFSLSCKFRSSVSGDFDHVFSRFHFSQVTHQRKSHNPLRGSLVHVCVCGLFRC